MSETASGRGGGTGLALIRGPRGATITQNVAVETLAAQSGPWAVLRCRVAFDQRLENCRVQRAWPADSGVGRAALRASREYRFRPATTTRRGPGAPSAMRVNTNSWVTLGFSFPDGLPEE